MQFEHVSGKNCGKIVIYALSTCVWCKRTKKMLSDMGIDYYFADVDLLSDEEQEEVQAELNKWSPDGSFPTVVFEDKECILGYQPEEMKKRLK